MTSEQANFLLHEVLLPQIESEHQTTRRLIEALPSGKGDYKPHEKSMTAWKLATHIVTSQIFFLEGIASGKFDRGTPLPESITTPEQLLVWDAEHFAKAVAALKGTKGEDLAKELNLGNAFVLPAVTFAQFSSNHTIHHRGQLSSYIRPMGGKVPGIYGSSADTAAPATA
jgi:uncharacterized damage-inducible protein DinB